MMSNEEIELVDETDDPYSSDVPLAEVCVPDEILKPGELSEREKMRKWQTASPFFNMWMHYTACDRQK